MQLFGTDPWPRISWIMNMAPSTKQMPHNIYGTIHTFGSYLLYALWIAHVGGELKHELIDKEAELQRMLP